MSPADAVLAFALAAGVVTLTPGVDTALVLRTATVESRWRAMRAGAGVCTGVLAWGLAAAIGLGALLAASEAGYTLLRWLGAGYLVYLGGGMLLRPRATWTAAEDGPRADGRGWFRRGLLTNLLNPKVGAFYVTFLPQFVPDGVAAGPFMVLLATVHAAESLAWFAALVLATVPLARLLRRSGVIRSLDRLTGGVLVAFGLRLALVDRGL